MALRISFPRICIALGISDPSQLFENADREAEASESFLEFRLDYLNPPEQGIEVIGAVLAAAPVEPGICVQVVPPSALRHAPSSQPVPPQLDWVWMAWTCA